MIKPLNGGLIIQRLYPKKRGLIVTPSLGHNETVIGKIVAKSDTYIQNGVKQDVFVNVGDIVVYSKPHELPFYIGREKSILVYITSVIAVIKDRDNDFTNIDPDALKPKEKDYEVGTDDNSSIIEEV